MRLKKAIYYSLDALLAGFLLVGVAVILLHLNFYEPKTTPESFITQDVLNILDELTIQELNYNPFIQSELDSGNIRSGNLSVLEQIGDYWALNQTNKSTRLFEIVFNDSLDDVGNFNFLMGNDSLYINNESSISTLVTSRRMISGVAKGEAIAGSTASAYLKKVHNKKNTAYAYIGGYVGQGNLTVRVDLPSDFSSSKFISAKLKVETPSNFSVNFNGISCGSNYFGVDGEVSLWDLSACNNSLLAGSNKINFVFNDDLNESYFSGGFLKITYITDTLNEDLNKNTSRYYFPGIDGFVNLYDSFSAQGLITDWFVNLTLYSEYDTFLAFGNETVLLVPGSNKTRTVTASKKNITIAPTEIPLRLAVTNLSNISLLQDGKPSDSFLVTDVSGSMDDCGQNYTHDVKYCSYEYKFWFWWVSTECEYPGSCSSNECGGTTTTRNHLVYNKTVVDCNKTLLDIAKEADDLFVDVVLSNSTLNKIGLVDFSSNANPPTDLTNVAQTLHSEISSYTAGGATCTCCAINRAKDLLASSTNDKYMIVLSDGEPTAYCNGFSDYTGSSGDNAQARQDAIDSGQEACANNITVYTIGFGDSMTPTGKSVMEQTACNSSLYFDASNVSQLVDIYNNISNQILVATNYTSQTINVVGNYSKTNISSDSYIDLTYDPLLQTENQGKLSVNFESNQFGSCNASVYIPENIVIENAFVTSFSSNHWTKSLLINNISVFNLTSYGDTYSLLGDPFIIQIPSAYLIPGIYNNISLDVGDSPDNSSLCSPNNTLIYTALINSSTPRSNVFETYEGCSWSIESESGKVSSFSVPSSYNGSNKCFYNSTNIIYDASDAYDWATHNLLTQLDPDGNGKVLVDLESSDLEITITLVNGVPYLWGPSIVSTYMWN